MLALADPEDMLALERVEQLVLVLMHVQRRVDRVDLLEDAHRRRGGPDEHLDVAEAQALAGGGGMGTVSWSMSATLAPAARAVMSSRLLHRVRFRAAPLLRHTS